MWVLILMMVVKKLDGSFMVLNNLLSLIFVLIVISIGGMFFVLLGGYNVLFML